MKKWFVLAIIVGLGFLMWATCPDKKDHQEAIKAVVINVVDEEISKLPSVVDDVAELVGLPLARTLLNVVMNNKLKVKNYYLFSIGEVTYKGETRMVSLGILGHVFTFDEDDLREAVKKKK